MAAKMLIEGIKAQKLAVGDKLPPERVIAQEMSLSRNTVREAIATLQIMGILETRQSQGNYVINAVDENNYETFLSLIFKTDESPFALIDARIAFEPGAALFCSRTCSENDIKSLSSRVDRISQALADDDIKTYRIEDQLFHLSIAQMTRNILIINTISSLLNAMKNPLWQAMKNAIIDAELRESRTREHKDIFQAIALRDELVIITAVQTHLENSKLRFFVEDDLFSSDQQE
ncbi:MAG: FadR family transcriptional regulator [Desulfobacterales bacterium]|nr:FCD domain-containing protein [Deltaproteobacteria bacterium]NNK95781.1 FadR family transcriptional regulator [Desulfobacterales bacterium]